MSRSNFSLMKQRINEMFGVKEPFWKRRSVKEVTLRARDIDYLRAEVFLEDIVSVAGDDSIYLTIPELVCLLYEDFLFEIRNSFDVESIIINLSNKRLEHFRKVDSNNIKLRCKWVSYSISMKRPLALRGEVFLHDLAMSSGEFEMSLDELLSILFMDFMAEVRKGNQRGLIKKIISRMESWSFN
ncbi:hypothetical protein PAV_14c00160 [Paenibacillus alvei DSM 29]|nr:hypothetical protein [Paenibacillus alvei]EJW14323.1 hypothetical protein PAV_14c00160 [Paenibacillus alvei DSM 29]